MNDAEIKLCIKCFCPLTFVNWKASSRIRKHYICRACCYDREKTRRKELLNEAVDQKLKQHKTCTKCYCVLTKNNWKLSNIKSYTYLCNKCCSLVEKTRRFSNTKLPQNKHCRVCDCELNQTNCNKGSIKRNDNICCSCRYSLNVKNRKSIKDIVFKEYGGCCKCCGESNFVFLTIDHIDETGVSAQKRMSSFWRKNVPLVKKTRLSKGQLPTIMF